MNAILKYNASVSLKNQLKAINATLATKETPLAFRAHYVKGNVNGIEQLITKILTKHNAVNPAGIESSNMRNIGIAQSMFASEVIAAVRKEFGYDRYPDATIYQYLSVNMVKNESIARIKLTNNEDSSRECCKPRTKFYLVLKSTMATE
jgi:hypothetical protein